MAYIYVIHFHRPLAHASHYIGCTEHLTERLQTHADGRGARILRELMKTWTTWRLGGLYTCSHKEMRRLERGLKDQHNAQRYCEICSKGEQRRIGKATAIAIDLAPQPNRQYGKENTDTEITIRLATPENELTNTKDLATQIRTLMRRDKDALGFIPVGGSAGINALLKTQRLAIACRGDELLGYAAYTGTLGTKTANVHQCCVKDQERFSGVGRKLIELISQTDIDTITAKVRMDLAANEFWTAIGFQNTGSFKHKTSGSTINSYRKELPCTNSKVTERTESTTKENEHSLPHSSPELAAKQE